VHSAQENLRALQRKNDKAEEKKKDKKEIRNEHFRKIKQERRTINYRKGGENEEVNRRQDVRKRHTTN
jgi:hypothetical protein